MNRTIAGLSASLLLLAAPTTAFAANVSSQDGSGYQYIAKWYPCGAKTYGNLKSKSGDRVYYSGLAMFGSLIADEDYGRYTADTSSRTLVGRSGTIGPTGKCAYRAHFTGIKTRVCRNRPHLPDPCGSRETLRK
ncbi:MAG: hypothetical protein NTX33_11940 [Propionibacteriales bacterium]|nr:hypothetical protein [Propionibacteriales bacterium]